MPKDAPDWIRSFFLDGGQVDITSPVTISILPTIITLANVASAVYGAGAVPFTVAPLPRFARRTQVGINMTAIAGGPASVNFTVQMLGPDSTWYDSGSAGLTAVGRVVMETAPEYPQSLMQQPVAGLRLLLGFTGGAAPTATFVCWATCMD